MEEVWSPVPGYEEIYEVSNLGQVRSLDRVTTRVQRGTLVEQPLKGRVLKAGKSTPYLTVNLCKDGKSKMVTVHEIVAEVYLGPRPPKQQVCHRNGDGYNARCDNLRYGTPRSNSMDRYEHGTDAQGEKNPGAKLTEQSVREIRELIAVNESDSEIAMRFNCSRQTISSIRNKRRWGHLDG